MDKGPLLAREALDAKLIDHLGYRDEFDAAVKALDRAKQAATDRDYRQALNDALDARATQQEQVAAHVTSSVCTLLNGCLVGVFTYAVFHALITLINVSGEW